MDLKRQRLEARVAVRRFPVVYMREREREPLRADVKRIGKWE